MASIPRNRHAPAKTTKAVQRVAERDGGRLNRRPGHKFASEDLIGTFDTGQGTAGNAIVRRVARQRLRARYRKHR